jgi:lysophospholipid acyltransferase (LPLAT)-like uncharacterized protein
MGKWLLIHLLPYLLAPLYWLLSKTWRIRESGPAAVLARYVQAESRAPCVYAHWHGDELVLVAYYSFRRLAVLSSLSKDGSLMARTLELLGYQVFRGSSSKGGVRGLIGLIRAVKAGSQSALAVDGPKGPLYEVKPGVIELAHRTGAPIIPVRTRCDRAWKIPRAWNGSYVPKFFALVYVEYGEPLVLPPSWASAAPWCARVKTSLDALAGQALKP